MQSTIVPLFNTRNRSLEDIMRELEDAYVKQASLLPYPFENQQVKVDMMFYPLHEISGDFFDVWYDTKSKELNGYMIDATGHNICSALQVFALRTLFRCSADLPGSLVTRMEWINRKMLEDERHAPFHAAAIMFSLKQNGALCYTAAGISPVYVYMDRKPAFIDMYGSLLGSFDDAEFTEYCMRLSGGDQVIFMTDGFSDRMEKEDNVLDPAKMLSAMRRTGHDPLRRDDASAIVINMKGDSKC